MPLVLLQGKISAMGVKQQKIFCLSCGRTTNHVTWYEKSATGTVTRAEATCFDHEVATPTSSEARMGTSAQFNPIYKRGQDT